MATIYNFEDLETWARARLLCRELHAVLKEVETDQHLALIWQAHRSAGSVMDNIAEGFARDSKKEHLYFLYIAKASCTELKSQLYRLLDTELVIDEDFRRLMNLATDVSKLIGGFIRYLKESKWDGLRKR